MFSFLSLHLSLSLSLSCSLRCLEGRERSLQFFTPMSLLPMCSCSIQTVIVLWLHIPVKLWKINILIAFYFFLFCFSLLLSFVSLLLLSPSPSLPLLLPFPIRSGLKSTPKNAKVHYNYANYLKDTGNLDEAVKHYETAIRLVFESFFFLVPLSHSLSLFLLSIRTCCEFFPSDVTYIKRSVH